MTCKKVTLTLDEDVVLFDQLASVDGRKLGAPLLNMEKQHSAQFKTALDVLFFNYP